MEYTEKYGIVGGWLLALLDDVKSELAAIDNELPAAKKAQATAMIRFGGGLRLVQRQIIVQAQFDSLDAAKWLQSTIKNLYGHEATLTQVARQTPNGMVQRYLVQVERGGAALALQTGLQYTKFISYFYVFIGLKAITDGLLRGAGDVAAFTIANLVNLSIRVIVTNVFAPIYGIQVAWMAVPLGWAANYLISFSWYLTGKWKKVRVIDR